MLIFSIQSSFGAILLDSTSISLSHGWWIITKFGMVNTETCGSATRDSFCTVLYDPKSGGLKLKKMITFAVFVALSGSKFWEVQKVQNVELLQQNLNPSASFQYKKAKMPFLKIALERGWLQHETSSDPFLF